MGASIEDLRGTPTPLVHPSCFASDALVAVVHAHDEIVRRNEYRRWRKDQGLA
jgi:hypothetical protein